MSVPSPTHSALQSDQRLLSPAFCCSCLHSRIKRADEVKEKPFQAKKENEAPSLQHPPAPAQTQRNNVQRSSTKDSVTTVYDLPPGWKAVTSRSRPDRTAFLNEFTGERISWVPTEPASTVKGEIRKTKRKSRINNDRESANSSGSDNTAVRASYDQRNDLKRTVI